MNDFVRCTNCAGKTIGRCRDCGIAGADQRQVCVLGYLGQMRVDGLDGEGAGNFAGVAAAHPVTDDIQSERRVGHKAIFVMEPFQAGIGLGAMQAFEGQTIPPSCCETMQTGTEFAREFFRAPIAVR